MSIRNNESIYDEQIAPLMVQIIRICKEAGIPMAASYEYDSGAFCATAIPVDGQSDGMAQIQRLVRNDGHKPLFQITTTKPDGSKILEVVLP